MVFQGTAEPHRPPARHQPSRPGASPLFRSLCGDRPGRGAPEDEGAAHRGEIPSHDAGLRRPVPRHDGRGSNQGTPAAGGCGVARRRVARFDEIRDVAIEAHQVREAPESRGCLPQVGQQARMDDSRCHSGDSAGTASSRSARRRPVRDLGPERSVPPRDQPEQPPEETHGIARPRGDHP